MFGSTPKSSAWATGGINQAGGSRAFFASWRLGEKLLEGCSDPECHCHGDRRRRFRIHTNLGPGLLESVYHTVLAYELGRRGFRTVRSSSGSLWEYPHRHRIPRRSGGRRQRHCRNQIRRVARPDPQEAASDLSQARRQASGIADQLPCAAHQRRHHAHRQSTRSRCSRQVAKPPRRQDAKTPRRQDAKTRRTPSPWDFKGAALGYAEPLLGTIEAAHGSGRPTPPCQ